MSAIPEAIQLPRPPIRLATDSDKPMPPPHVSLWLRFWHWTGVIAMPNTPQPTVWGFSPSVLTLLLFIGGLIASASWYLGHQASVIENIQKQADAAQLKADKAMDIANGDKTPTATPTVTPKERK